MKTITTTSLDATTQLNMDEFAKQMLAAEASGTVDKIEVPAQKPANKIFVKKSIKKVGGASSRYELVLRGCQPTTMNRRELQMMYLPYMNQIKEIFGEYFFDYNINTGISSSYMTEGVDGNNVPYETEVVGKYAKLAKFLKDMVWSDLGYVREWVQSCNGGGIGTANVGLHYPWYQDVVLMQMSAHRLNSKAHALKLKTMEKHGRWISKADSVKLVLKCLSMPMSKLATVAAAKSLKLGIIKTFEKTVSLVNRNGGFVVRRDDYNGGWGRNWSKDAPKGEA